MEDFGSASEDFDQNYNENSIWSSNNTNEFSVDSGEKPSQNTSNPELLKLYFEIFDEYKEKYENQKIVVLMEVGTFYEMRGAQDDHETHKIIKDLSYKLSLTTFYINNKKKPSKPIRTNPICIGFQKQDCDTKFFPKIVDLGYWIVLVKQSLISEEKGDPSKCKSKAPRNNGVKWSKSKSFAKKKFTRQVTQIINKSTYIQEEIKDSSTEPTILAVFYDEIPFTAAVSLGMTLLKVSTGFIQMYDEIGSSGDLKRPLEDFERWIYGSKPTQILWISEKKKGLSEFIENNYEVLHMKTNENYKNIDYQEQILERYFAKGSQKKLISDSVIDYLGLTYLANGRLSLLYLIQFLWDTNKEILHGMQRPQIQNLGNSFILEKNAIKQLFIHEFIDMNVFNCHTHLGKELLIERLTNPSNDPTVIKRWLHFAKNIGEIILDQKIALKLHNLKRFDYVLRRISVKKCSMKDLFYFWKMLLFVKKKIFEIPLLKKLIEEVKEGFEETNLDHLMDELAANFHLDVLSKGSDDFTIYKKRFLDEQEKYRGMRDTIIYFRDFIQEKVLLNPSQKLEIKETKTEGIVFTLLMSSKCFDAQRKIENLEIQAPLFHTSTPHESERFLWNKTTMRSFPNTKKQPSFVHIELSGLYVETKETLKNNISSALKEDMQNFYDIFETELQGLCKMIAKIDLALATAKAAKKYNYVCPEIIDKIETDKDVESLGAHFDIKNLRHPIIEIKLLRSTYIPQDFRLNDETPGLMIYGINSSGKTSSMRSVGMTVAMAQAGLFVPASSFILCPFDNIMTRIMGGDDMMKGMSSYIVEVMECNQIATRATNNTLVLGDEIFHSTEIGSGTCLVSALTDHMLEHKTKFMVATHMRSLKQLCVDPDKLMHKYIHVGKKYVEKDKKEVEANEWNEENNEKESILLFDRIVQEGTGPDAYGIEMAERSGMNKKITHSAYKKYKEIQNYPEWLVTNVSRNNKRKLLEPICSREGCTNPVEEEDHIIPQYRADADGFVDSSAFHKNHPTNLTGLCRSCHRQKTNRDIKDYHSSKKKEKEEEEKEEEEIRTSLSRKRKRNHQQKMDSFYLSNQTRKSGTKDPTQS